MKKGRNWFTAVLSVVLLSVSTPSLALNITAEDGSWELDLDTIVSYSAQWRLTGVDEGLYEFVNTGNIIVDLTNFATQMNFDDGDRNFSRGLVQNKLSIVSELDFSWRNIGLFARGRAYYDAVYDADTDQNARGLLSYNSATLYGGDAAPGRFPSGTVDKHRDRLEMLDYFLYYGGSLPGDRLFDLRIGSQVINWGEATFYQGINGLQNRADLIARNTPGVEVKEILLPSGAVYGQLDLNSSMTLEAYYQYEWRETELNGVGSFFSERDMLGPGAANLLGSLGEDPVTGNPIAVFSIPRTADNEPSDSGQWGLALHWISEAGADIGLYVVNAHSRTPSVTRNTAEGAFIPSSYTISYFEDIRGYAASFTTVLGITNVQGEIAYKKDTPLVLANNSPVAGDMITAQIGGSHVLTPTRFWDDANLTFEVAAAEIDSHQGDELLFDDKAWAIALRLELSYLNVIPGLDLRAPIFLQHTIDGSILEANMIDEASTFNLTVKAIYLNNLTVQFGYTNYFDGGRDHLLTDRDNLSFSVSYSF